MDAHRSLLQNIGKVVRLTHEEQDLVCQAFHPVALKKKEFLLEAGQYSNHMRFVAQGCLKLFQVDDAGNEHILFFGMGGWWINDLYAYLTETPATYSLQAITDSVVLQIHRNDLDRLFDEVHMIERFFRMKTQKGYVALQERTTRSMSQSAEQRYADFIKRYRDMEQQIPQYMIASYLGVTPEHLSAIRSKISR